MSLVTTFIAAKGEKNLTQEEIDRYCLALGSKTRWEWLEEGVACDIFHAQPRPSFTTQHARDIVTQPSENRRKKLLLADMDSTLIEQECIDELADYAGIKEHIASITQRAMNGELAFEDALRERVALLADLPEEALEVVWRTHITLMPGAKTLGATMKANGAYLAIVSGGFTFFTARVREALNFDEDHSNLLEISGGTLTGNVLPPILGQDAKKQQLERLQQNHRLTREQTMAIGDGANDIPMLQAAGLGVACHAKPFVQQQVSAQLNHNDLSALLYVQGYQRKEWV